MGTNGSCLRCWEKPSEITVPRSKTPTGRRNSRPCSTSIQTCLSNVSVPQDEGKRLRYGYEKSAADSQSPSSKYPCILSPAPCFIRSACSYITSPDPEGRVSLTSVKQTRYTCCWKTRTCILKM